MLVLFSIILNPYIINKELMVALLLKTCHSTQHLLVLSLGRLVHHLFHCQKKNDQISFEKSIDKRFLCLVYKQDCFHETIAIY